MRASSLLLEAQAINAPGDVLETTARADGRGRPGVVDRLCQCSEPTASADDGAAKRNRSASGDWRGARPHTAPTPDRKHAAVLDRSDIRDRVGLVIEPCSSGDS